MSTKKLKRWWNHFWKNDLLEGFAELHYKHWKIEHAFETQPDNNQMRLESHRPSTKLCSNCEGLGGFPPSLMANGGQCPICKGLGVVDNSPFSTLRGNG